MSKRETSIARALQEHLTSEGIHMHFVFYIKLMFQCDRAARVKGGEELNADRLKSYIMESLKICQWL